MPGFHSKLLKGVTLDNTGHTAQQTNNMYPMLFSDAPLKPGAVWTIKVPETTSVNAYAVLGVTGCDPDSLTSLPVWARSLPQSRVLYGSCLYRDGEKTADCDVLSVATGDTYGVSWTPGSVTYYLNRSVHYMWEVDTPDTTHFWGVMEMYGLNRISVLDKDPVTLKFACMQLIKAKVGSDVIHKLEIPESLKRDIKQLYCVYTE